MRRLIAGFGLSVLAVIAHTTPALAATPAAAPPIVSLTPAIQDRVLGPNETTTNFTVELSNQNDRPLTFSLSTNDFTTANQTGGLTFLGSDVSRVTKGNGLSGIITLDSRLVTVPAKSSRTITATVNNVRQLAPGGHYAAVLAQILPDGTPTVGNRVAINQVVSSLFFLETAGKGTKTLQLLKPQVTTVSFSLPREANLVFKATGNTQTIPRGVISITHGSKVVQRAIINPNSSLILPGSTRLLQTPLQGGRQPLLPGIYTMRVEYRYDGSLGITTYEQRFLYINLPVLTLLASLLGIGSYIAWYERSRIRTAMKHFKRDNHHKVKTTSTSLKSKK